MTLIELTKDMELDENVSITLKNIDRIISEAYDGRDGIYSIQCIPKVFNMLQDALEPVIIIKGENSYYSSFSINSKNQYYRFSDLRTSTPPINVDILVTAVPNISLEYEYNKEE